MLLLHMQKKGYVKGTKNKIWVNLFWLSEYISPESLDLDGVKVNVDLYTRMVEGCINNRLRDMSVWLRRFTS